MTCRGGASFSRRTLLATAGALMLSSSARAQFDKVSDRERAVMHVGFAFADQTFTATLEDNPSARDLFSMLPLDLTINDYSTNEKIAYLPRKLNGEGRDRFGGETAGDLCYYAPWGNLVMFYDAYRWLQGLIRLGRLDHGPQPLLVRGAYPLHVEVLS